MTSIKIRPLQDHIVAVRLVAEDKTAGGLIVPDTAKEKPLAALVVAVGAGKVIGSGKTVPMSVKAGDTVLIGKYSGAEVKLDGKDHLILREDEVLGVVEAEAGP